ncbi:MAG TPA: TCP-1/cpn60 chaperonin family protein, partial [Chloroflexaceae bacterium]|nr:TCP-1/cpn60 chaperonin family protein [Chloroflexaceae bacterium]
PAEGEARYGLQAVSTALRAPHARIIANAGRRDAPALLAELGRRGPTWGYDPLRGELADLRAAGVLDPAAVAAEALRAAASVAVMLLTTDAVVLRRNPPVSFEP